MTEKKKLSCFFNGIKGIAICCVVLAHSSYYNLSNGYLVSLFGKISNIGVFCFLFTSGYFYNKTEKNFSTFFKSKVFNILVPWLFAASVLYVLRIRSGVYGIFDFLNWFFGNGSLYYYITVLFVLYLIFWPFKKVLF